VAERDRLDLTEVMTRLAGLLFSEETLQSMLDVTSQLARATFPDAAGAGVTLIRNGRKFTAAYTDEVVEHADALQYQLDEGPCLAAWRDNTIVRMDDMQTEDRWPRWTAAAAVLEIRSSVSAPLRVRGEALGACKVYSRIPGSFDASHEELLSMFGESAAIVLANMEGFVQAQEASEQLKEALVSRDVIGQAKGILMEREGIDDEAAFAMLRQASQTRNVKLRNIARSIVETTRGRAPGASDEG